MRFPLISRLVKLGHVRVRESLLQVQNFSVYLTTDTFTERSALGQIATPTKLARGQIAEQ